MKWWLIILAVVVAMVGAVALGRGGHEGLATKAELQGSQNEMKGSVDKLTTSVSTLTGLVSEVNGKAERAVSKITALEDQQKLDLVNIKNQIKTEALERKVEEVGKQKDIEREISELKLKMSGTVPVTQYALPQFIPSSLSSPAYRYGSFGVTQSGRYSFVVEPYYAVFSVDGQRVANGQIVYLAQGWHNWSADSEVSFRTSWVGYQ